MRGGTDGLKVLRDRGLVDGVETPYEVAPGVTLEPAAGHTRTSAVVRVEDGEREAVFVGHLFLHPAQVHRYERAELEEDPPTAIATRVRLLDDAASRGTVLFGDLWAAPGYGKVTKAQDNYELV